MLGRAVLSAVLLAGIWASPAVAQVTVNPGALDLLPAPKPPPVRSPPHTGNRAHAPAHRTAPAAAPATPPAVVSSPSAPPAASQAAGPPAPAAPATKPPSIPIVPPAVAALPPPAPLPAASAQAAPAIAVAADAPGTAAPLPHGLRLTFGPDRQDLNPVTEAALRNLARTELRDPSVSVNIYAYAPGVAEDPSTSRRLSLGRALAARAVLINEGVASTRIYPRALGPTGGDVDKDRVDVVAGPPAPPPAAVSGSAGSAPPASASAAETPNSASPTAAAVRVR